MGSRLTIGVDIDGVLADFTGEARGILKKLFNKPNDDEVQTGWGFDTLGITDAETNLMWDVINAQPNWWLTLKKLPKTDLLTKLDAQHQVIFITNRVNGAGLPVEKQSALWLMHNYGIQMPTVLLSGNKGPLAASLGLDYYIDDRPENLDSVLDYHVKCGTYLMDATYNQSYDRTTRVGTFNEFARLIDAN